MKNVKKLSWVIYTLLIITLFISCKKKETTPAVIASFTKQADAVNFKKVTFTNQSQNYVSLLWNFGDNTTSTEVNPIHIFPDVGTYAVKLSATGSDGTVDSYSENVTISDPNLLLTALTGDVSKTWKLLRVTSTGRYPLECGPEDHSTIWWAMGKDNNELGNRPCMLNDEFILGRDMSLVYDAKGDYWAEGGIFNPANICALTTDPMVGPNGEDLSAWGSGSHTFELIAGTPPQIKAVGMGAFLGFYKLGNGSETKIPLDHVTYDIVKLTTGTVDTLVIEGIYRWDPTTTGGYWRFVLMHYTNPADEPPMPGNKPNAGFTFTYTGLAVTFTNTSAGATSYSWDFGDGQTSTAASPVHTYAHQGIYTIVLTATNSNGSATATGLVFLGTDPATLTGAEIIGNPWRVSVSDNSIFVGSGMGKNDWWHVSKTMFESGTGGDDWTCMPDDEFTFSAGGAFSYNTMGFARNDSYFGTPNGCWSDAEIAASPTGVSFGSCATHTYVFTPGAIPTITLTNGAGYTAFIGFYKGYNGVASGIKGGENNGTDPPNFGSATNTYQVMGYANTGTKEYLFVSVDLSADHTGGSAWSAILER